MSKSYDVGVRILAVYPNGMAVVEVEDAKGSSFVPIAIGVGCIRLSVSHKEEDTRIEDVGVARVLADHTIERIRRYGPRQGREDGDSVAGG